ncbi:MAG: TonB-dependent receptor [Candidatus Marinimicrobia bacterium]|nr:TonB-dependent receptor [Candidatus Neomarinimicrobiota bacterium]
MNNAIRNILEKPVIIFCLLCLTFLIPAVQAATTGKISGVVTDAVSGEPLIGLNVIVDGIGMGAASDINGYYLILNVRPGTYTLRLSMIGYQTKQVENVSVISDHTTTINIELNQVSLEASEVVTVTATRPTIQFDRTSTESSVSATQIAQMPVESVQDILNLQAGVVEGHFRGGRSQEVVYQIDGIPINDAYSGDATLFVENDVIQELKVISGTFNAEYGQAQSGIVDIITKTGASHLTGSLSMSLGDYVTSHNNIFWNIDDRNPTDYTNINLYLSGPLGQRLNFLMNYRTQTDDGYLYGRNVFLPVDTLAYGDNSYHAMGYNNSHSLFAKLSLRLTDHDRLALSSTFQVVGQNRDFGIYDHLFRYNPLGQGESKENAAITLFSWNHLLSSESFFNIRASYSMKDHSQYTFEDSLDERYSTDGRLRQTGSYSFYTGGTDMVWITRSSLTALIRGDYTKQISRAQQIQMGVQLKTHQLKLHDIKLKKNAETNFQVTVPTVNTADNQQYLREPIEGAAYIQTKWESSSLIMNLGIRYDYFDAKGLIIEDLSRPRTSSTKASSTTQQISPRIGISYPITNTGVMHVSYGHFFQIPEFQYLYANPNFTVNPEEGLASVLNYPFGNANLKSQKTVAYEIGLQQELSPALALDVTAYSKDIRNLLGSELNTIATGEEHSGIQYGRYVNRDYGHVKGLTFMLEMKAITGFSGSVDYTFQVARGNASDPKSVLIDSQSDPPAESEKQLVALNWDQTHTLNTQLTFQSLNGYVITVLGKVGSGMPYTPSVAESQAVIENSERKPYQMTFELYAKKSIQIGKLALDLTLKTYNLFDRLNESDVYGDSGRASYTRDLYNTGDAQGLNTKAEYFTRPDWYQSPRRVIFGISTNF